MSQFYDSDTGYPNLHAPYLIPEEFRVQHQLQIRVFDTKFKPFFTSLFPATESEGKDGAKGVEVFSWPIMTSPRPMARLYGRDEKAEYLNAGGIKEEWFNTVITKQGFERRYDEFEGDFTNGLIGKKYKLLMEQTMEAINKRIEFECGNVLYHNTYAINQFSKGYDLSRSLTANISDGKFYQYDHSTELSDLAGLLSGTQWHKAGDPLRDFDAISRAHEGLKGTQLTKAFFGPETIMWLDNNDKIRDLIKYHKDATQGVLGSTLKGVKINKVIGNDLKESTHYSGSEAPPMYYPGMGDLDYDKYTDRNKVPLMVDGGINGREWGIMAEESVGNLFHSYINTKHKAQTNNATVPYTKAFDEDDPERRKVRFEKAFCPTMEDPGNYVLILNTVNRADR